MLRVGAPLVAAAVCGGALSGCGTQAPPSIQPAWDNHFAGFAAGVQAKNGAERNAALDKIMADYDAKSIVSIWDVTHSQAENCKDKDAETCKQPAAEFNSLEAIRSMFDDLFDDLVGCLEDGEGKLDSDLRVIQPTVSATGSVFLVWECKKKGFLKATDTFVFDGVVIRKQNIVVETSSLASRGLWQPSSLSQGLLPQDECNQEKPHNVQCAWDNHFTAFGMGSQGSDKWEAALDKIMLDYIEESIAHLVVYEDDKKIPDFKEFKGLTGPTSIRTMFVDLFKSIEDNCNLGAPLVEVTGDDGSTAKQVFLVWKLPASQYKWATDTFIFDDDFKIVKQNIVAVQGPKDTTGCPTTAPASAPATEVVV